MYMALLQRSVSGNSGQLLCAMTQHREVARTYLLIRRQGAYDPRASRTEKDGIMRCVVEVGDTLTAKLILGVSGILGRFVTDVWRYQIAGFVSRDYDSQVATRGLSPSAAAP